MISISKCIARLLIAVITGFVVIQLLPVIKVEWTGGDGCPRLGPIPACYLIALCYLLMGFVSVISPDRLRWLFWGAWMLVVLFAGIGTTLELSGQGTCPVSGSGVPLCYYSMAVAVLLAVLFSVVMILEKYSVGRQ